MWKLYIIKSKYIINKFIYFFLKTKTIKLLIKISNYFGGYLLLMRNIIEDDFFLLKSKKDQFKENYLKLSFPKHIIFLFFLLTGVVPLLVFFYLMFFFFKYCFKYLYLTLDYFFPFLRTNRIYLSIITISDLIFISLPNFLSRILGYFFGGGWTRFFLNKIKTSLKNRWLKFLSSFFSRTDEIILVKSPNMYMKFKEKFVDLYYWSIRVFFIFQRKLKDFLRGFRNFFLRIFRKIRRKNRLVRRIYDKWFRIYYYRWYFIYIRTYIYYAWIFRKYIWSDAFRVTLEAYFFIAFWNLVACIKYSLALLYTRLQYIYSEIIFSIWTSIIYLEFSLKNFLEYLYYKSRISKIYLHNRFIEFNRRFIFYFSSFMGQIIYGSPYAWYWWRHQCYEVDKGFISLMWYSLKFYAIIQRFFRRLYPLPFRLFFFNRKIKNLAFMITYESVWRVVLRRFIEGCYFMFYIKFIYFI